MNKSNKHQNVFQLILRLLGRGGDLFSEKKALRKCPATVATSMDGATENIPEHFGEIEATL